VFLKELIVFCIPRPVPELRVSEGTYSLLYYLTGARATCF
jgi:hypothetical protein